MPVIRIEIPEGTPSEIKKTVRIEVKQAVLETLAPKETKNKYRVKYPVTGQCQFWDKESCACVLGVRRRQCSIIGSVP